MNRSMLTAALLVVAMTGLTTRACRAGEYDQSLVPADSVAVVHVDFQGLLQSEFGKLVVADLKAVGLDEKIAEVKAQLGLDPLVDLNSATLAGNGWGDDDWVLIVRMSTNVEKLRELVRLNGDYTATTHNGHTVHSWIDRKCDPGKRKYCGDITPAGQDETLLVFGDDKKRVHAAMDVIDGTSPSLTTVKQGALANSPADGALVFVAAQGLDDMPAEKRRGKKLLMLSDAVVMNFGEKNDRSYADIDITADSAEQAQNMRAIAMGMVAMVALSDDANARELAVLTNDITVGGEGKAVTINFEHDSRDLHARLKAMHEARHGQRAAEEN